MSVRQPAVSGTFYNAHELKEQVESCFLAHGGPGRLPKPNPDGERHIRGLVCPHAGLVYSGAVAAHSYLALAEDGLPDTVALVGPNHRTYEPALALTSYDAWLTPLGEMPIDKEIVNRIADLCPFARVADGAHSAEHSLEVQLPFLQYLGMAAGKNIRIAPLLVGASADEESGGWTAFADRLASALAQAVEGRDCVIIASTDFTHFESSRAAEAKDSLAIAQIEAMDEDGLLETVGRHRISMCGALPTAVMLAVCKRMGASHARLLAYRNSGDVTGDQTDVVAYGALEITV